MAQLLTAPRHPYTIALLKSRAHGAMEPGQRLETIAGSPPDLSALPPGCSFAPRCPLAIDACLAAVPPLLAIDAVAINQAAGTTQPPSQGQTARCIRLDQTASHTQGFVHVARP